jgi:hypothetical protein
MLFKLSNFLHWGPQLVYFHTALMSKVRTIDTESFFVLHSIVLSNKLYQYVHRYSEG